VHPHSGNPGYACGANCERRKYVEWLCGVQVDQYRMVGIMLLVFVRSELYDAVSDVDVQWIGTGLLGRLVRRCSASNSVTRVIKAGAQ